ncbi:MAG: tRNA pseudouridine(55) synthase TruB [Acidobacteriota bacterium]
MTDSLDGVLVVDKPAGPTSHDVVARVRRALRTRRIGHTGTLDPLATGVLPLVIGRATRLAALFSGTEKEYEAGVRLGLATETYDAAGRVGPPPQPPDGIDALVVEAALDQFRGTYLQSPPAYSAKKIDGVAAYTLARRNEPVQPRAVTVTVTDLSLVSYAGGLARILVRASAGFYVRSLAHDLGGRLGCGGHIETLRRVKAGAFGEQQAVTLDTIEADGPGGARWLIPLNALLPHVPAIVLTERGARRASHGNALTNEDLTDAAALQLQGPGSSGGTRRWRLVDTGGTLLGIAEIGPGGFLHPVIVLV